MSPDGSQIAYWNPQTDTLLVLDWRENEIVWEVPANVGSNVDVPAQATWSPDGKYIAWVFPDSSLTIRDAVNGTQLETLELVLNNLRIAFRERMRGDRAWFTDFAWNSDGTQLAVMTSSYIIVFDLVDMEVQSVIDLLVVSSTLHDFLSTFAWSPDDSTFAALHFRLQDGREVFPLEVIMGFWDSDGRRLHEYEFSESDETLPNCISNAEDIWESRGIGLMGGIYEWSPDNRSLAVSEAAGDYIGYSICTLNSDGTLYVSPIADIAPSFIHWSSDQNWLYAITVNCILYKTALDSELSTETTPFGNTCYSNSATWSRDDRFIALGTRDGLWMGELSR